MAKRRRVWCVGAQEVAGTGLLWHVYDGVFMVFEQMELKSPTFLARYMNLAAEATAGFMTYSGGKLG